MLQLIQYILLGHIHKWETVARDNLSSGSAKGTRIELKCEKCGNVKKVDLI